MLFILEGEKQTWMSPMKQQFGCIDTMEVASKLL